MVVYTKKKLPFRTTQTIVWNFKQLDSSHYAY